MSSGISLLKSRFEWFLVNGSAIDPVNLYEFFIDNLPEFLRLSSHDYDIAVQQAIKHRITNNNNNHYKHYNNHDPVFFLSRDECRYIYSDLIHELGVKHLTALNNNNSHINNISTYRPNEFTVFLMTIIFWICFPLIFILINISTKRGWENTNNNEKHANLKRIISVDKNQEQYESDQYYHNQTQIDEAKKKNYFQNNYRNNNLNRYHNNNIIKDNQPRSILEPLSDQSSNIKQIEINNKEKSRLISSVTGANSVYSNTSNNHYNYNSMSFSHRSSSLKNPLKASDQEQAIIPEQPMLTPQTTYSQQVINTQNTTITSNNHLSLHVHDSNIDDSKVNTEISLWDLASSPSHYDIDNHNKNNNNNNNNNNNDSADDLDSETEAYVNSLLAEEEQNIQQFNPSFVSPPSRSGSLSRIGSNRGLNNNNINNDNSTFSPTGMDCLWLHKTFGRFYNYLKFSYTKQVSERGIMLFPIYLCFTIAIYCRYVLNCDNSSNTESYAFIIFSILFILLDSLRSTCLDYDDLLKRRFIQKFTYRLQKISCIHNQVDSMMTLATQAIQRPQSNNININNNKDDTNNNNTQQLGANALQMSLPLQNHQNITHGNSVTPKANIINNNNNNTYKNIPITTDTDNLYSPSSHLHVESSSLLLPASSLNTTANNNSVKSTSIASSTALSVFEYVYRHRNTSEAKNRQRLLILLAIIIAFIHSCIPILSLVIWNHSNIIKDGIHIDIQLYSYSTAFRISSIIVNTGMYIYCYVIISYRIKLTQWFLCVFSLFLFISCIAAFSGLLIVFFSGLNHWAIFTRIMNELSVIASPNTTDTNINCNNNNNNSYNISSLRLDLHHPSNVSSWIETRQILTSYMHSGSSNIQSTANFHRYLLIFCLGFLLFYSEICADLFTKKFNWTQYEIVAIFDCLICGLCLSAHILLASKLNVIMKEHVNILRSQHFAIQRILIKYRELQRSQLVRLRQLALETNISTLNINKQLQDHASIHDDINTSSTDSNISTNTKNVNDELSSLESFRINLILGILTDSSSLIESSIEVISQADQPIKFLGTPLTLSFLYSAIGLFASVLIVSAANFADFQI